ncbi:MAG TPA: hypothetical protein VMV61_11605 [Patescibacteria group bacterium]|nr:hypothetical protein [Patescibacteria group bacterium]
MKTRPVVQFFACLMFAMAVTAGQSPPVPPVRLEAGTVLSFHLQTRFAPGELNATDRLPRGTVIRVKLLDPVDSATEADGSEFRGEVTDPVVSWNGVVIHRHAMVHGLLALLRSGRHPEGFRYELLLTGIKDQARYYELTASLNPEFADTSAPAASSTPAQEKKAAIGSRLPAPTPRW